MEMIVNYFLLITFAASAVVGLFYWAKWAFRHEKEYRELLNKNPDLAKNVLKKQNQNATKWNVIKKNIVEPICSLLGLLFIFLAILGPILTICYQMLEYLKKGFWGSLSLIDVMRYFKIKWALMPQDWFGLWNLLNFINVAFFIFFIFLLMGLLLLNSHKNK